MADEVRDRETDPRSLASKPFEELDEAAGSDQHATKLAGAKRAAATAGAAALVGALAGAAKAYADRRSSRSGREANDDDGDDAGDDAGPADEGDGAEAPQAEQAEQEGDEEQTDDEPEADAHEQADDEPETKDEGDEDDDPEPAGASANGHADELRGAPVSEAAAIVDQARTYLHSLIGAEAESVSALQRTNGTWKVTLEVVELRRVPESTDVLSSYDVLLDDDGEVVSLTRGRRYRRSQVEEER